MFQFLKQGGNLTDHYDPSKKLIKLSTDIYNGTSIASCAVAAHECGHAIQDKDNYVFFKILVIIQIIFFCILDNFVIVTN